MADPITNLLSPAELRTLEKTMTTQEAIAWQMRRAYVAKVARQRRLKRLASRPDGMRIRLSAIDGLTRGDAQRVLQAPYYFQCPPQDQVQKPRARTWNKRTNYLGDEYSERSGSPLRPFTFRTLAVEWGSFVIEQFYDVDWLVSALERLVDAGFPFQLLATLHYGDDAFMDMPAYLESVTPTINANENDAVYLDLTFSEYRDPIVTRRGTNKSWPEVAVLEKDGDWTYEGKKHFKKPLTFQLLAETAYGKPSLARHIMRAQKPPINDWGTTTPVIRHHRYKGKGGKIIVPAPPETHAKAHTKGAAPKVWGKA